LYESLTGTLAKQHAGSTVLLNSDVSDFPSLKEHDPELYLRDVQKVVDFARDPLSLFELSTQNSLHQLGQALRENKLVVGGPVQMQIGVGQPDSLEIHISPQDDADLGDQVNADGSLEGTDDVFIWKDPAQGKIHTIDGGQGANNTLVINLPS